MYFLGWDAGGTKSEMILSDEQGNHVVHEILGPLPYTAENIPLLRERVHSYLDTILEKGGIGVEEICCAGIGMPGYGEVVGSEEVCESIFTDALGKGKYRVVNDCVGGWYGSFWKDCGIHVSSGTGSIAYGQDADGNSMRCAGMSVYFADEGSCSWIGRQTIIAFIKQADGREDRTPLYELMRAHFGALPRDIYVVGEIDKLRYDVAAQAALQRVTLKAWEQGDPIAQKIYQKAAEELIGMAEAIRRKLTNLPRQGTVLSYSGGLFKAGDAIMIPFQETAKARDFILKKPKFPPFIGTLSLAAMGILPDTERIAMMEKCADVISADSYFSAS